MDFRWAKPREQAFKVVLSGEPFGRDFFRDRFEPIRLFYLKWLGRQICVSDSSRVALNICSTDFRYLSPILRYLDFSPPR